MKTNNLKTLFLIVVLFLMSCSTEPGPSPKTQEPDNKTLIINRWLADSTIVKVYNQAGKLLDEINEDVQEVEYEFFAELTYETSKPGHQTLKGTWDLVENGDFLFDNYPFQIIALDESQFNYSSTYDTVINKMAYRFVTIVKLHR